MVAAGAPAIKAEPATTEDRCVHLRLVPDPADAPERCGPPGPPAPASRWRPLVMVGLLSLSAAQMAVAVASVVAVTR